MTRMHNLIFAMDFFATSFKLKYRARLAQSVEHETLNLRVVGSSPTLGADHCWWLFLSLFLYSELHQQLGFRLNFTFRLMIFF